VQDGQFNNPLWMGTNKAGNILVLCRRKNVAKDQLSMILWTYDIDMHQWTSRNLDEGLFISTFNAGENKIVLYNTHHKGQPYDPAACSVLIGDHLESLKFLPKNWLGMSESSYYGRWRIHITEKHYYAWTPLGLWRKERILPR